MHRGTAIWHQGATGANASAPEVWHGAIACTHTQTLFAHLFSPVCAPDSRSLWPVPLLLVLPPEAHLLSYGSLHAFQQVLQPTGREASVSSTPSTSWASPF
jgi:hypothetical protein